MFFYLSYQPRAANSVVEIRHINENASYFSDAHCT
ncbi:Uncharacterised protein [Vibrio cholerae]|nr:Uncharacterised protein [Vibrio cholerae]